jgi:RimJ/RimL family protein N-acetyltransferase
MTRAVKLLIDNYTHIKTFRAYVLLDNVRSRQVLLNNNFVSKGISADKFFVNDAWRDHEEFVYTIER